ncbi:NfeD family protein [Parasphingopyxis algicola]|uniref:NfeD family protein n=1 Tax=Parasphingopyxis algicola TaxID=2026624 RepID=UPI001FE7227D|nr:nodulation protein NfeD [Parasphingopyxis algicola]
MRLEGAIGPASASFIADGLGQASQADAELVVISMDTPGGLDTSMREIIQAILAMPIPVVTYVHPSGARAASAGTYILYASHVAAMTPGTNLGAATPIQIGAAPSPEGDGEDGEAGNSPATAAERKAVNDAVAYIRSLAEMRGRNADWGEESVREAASLSADAALEQGVIDIVAPNLASLLEQLDGTTVTIDGETREVRTAGLTVREIEPGWTTQLLATITNPNIALILLMIGIYGMIFEFLNPGSLVPGTVGAICLLIGLYALAALPVDFVGLALILLGIGLMVGEAFAPSFGILGIGGLVALVFGATILFDTDVPEFRVNWSVIAAIGVFGAGLVILVARVGISSFKHRVVTGPEELIGASATVIDWTDGKGHVLVHSERWNAEGPEGLSEGQGVIVKELSGLKLTVSPSGDPGP